MIDQLTAQYVPRIEKALLKNLLVMGKIAIDEIADDLHQDLFFDPKHSQLCKVMLAMYANNRTIDFLTIGLEKPDLNELMLELLNFDAVAAGFSNATNADYVGILKQKLARRKLLLLHLELGPKIQNADDEELLTLTEQTYHQISEILSGKLSVEHISGIVQKSIQQLSHRMDCYQKRQISGVNTGSKRLNWMLSGWQPGDLYVLAGRPGMGKTAIALWFAERAATFGTPVLVFSLEMTAARLADRMIIGYTEIDGQRYNHGSIDNLEFDSLMQKAPAVENMPIYIDQASNPTTEYISAACRMAVRRDRVGMAIIDYLQLIDMREHRGITRDQAIGQVTRKLKQLAKELNIPIILLSQLNRAVEGRADKEPNLSDLRESGNIEQDADAVIMLYRPAYYGISNYDGRDTDERIWLLTRKYRHGQPKNIVLRHNESLTKFYNDDSTTATEAF